MNDNNKIDTILFDFDGTVMNTNNVIIQSWQHTFRTLEGDERPVEDIVETFGEPLVTTMKRFFPEVPAQKAVDIYRSYHYERFEDLISIFPGISDLLAQLKEQGYKTALVTSRLRGTTDRGMKKYDLDQYFDAVITMEDCTKHKPDPEPINIALEKLGSSPERAVMLGDTMYDIKCARNAGVKSILVSWAMAVTKDDLAGPDAPDHVIETADDLWGIIG